MRVILFLIPSMVSFIGSACSPPEERPALEEWLPAWDRALDLSSGSESMGGGELDAFCHDLLAGVRVARPDLMPTPDHALDILVEEWISEAESLGFQCPGGRGEAEDHAKAVRELRILEAEIDAGIQALSDTEPQSQVLPRAIVASLSQGASG